ncbi:AraC family transcriptional regulator [Sphingobacterium corticis]|uniref:AraC family transcriptional regulator n=1 Tax=Sphingobacterium corticis TaxID=1812823 RepID=A0ABW5NJ53_9SPHI
MIEPIQFTVPVYGEGLFAILENKAGYLYGYYHRHTELQVTCVLKGKGTIAVGNVAQSFQEGDLFILRPDEPHLFNKYEEPRLPDDEVHLVHVFVHSERIQRLFAMPEFDQVADYLSNLNASKKIPSEFGTALMPFFEALSTKTGIPRFLDFIGMLHALALNRQHEESLYSGARKTSYSDKDGVRISAVYKYTFDHLHEEINLDDVADLVHMTTSAFCKFFKKHTTKTYVGFLNEVRIEKACQLLVNRRTESISETAFQVGFKNAVHFNRVFKQITGSSPRQYVNNYAV